MFERTVTIDGVPYQIANRSLVLVFDSSNWDQAQTVYVYAPDDPRRGRPRGRHPAQRDLLGCPLSTRSTCATSKSR
jgi:hypothetical protein